MIPLHWKIRKTTSGCWRIEIRRLDGTGRPGWKRTMPTFEAALRYVIESRSRALVADVLDRAVAVEDPNECESIRAVDIIVPSHLKNIHRRKRQLAPTEILDLRRIALYNAGRTRGLAVRTEVEVEDDPSMTRIFVWARPNPNLMLKERTLANGKKGLRYTSQKTGSKE